MSIEDSGIAGEGASSEGGAHVRLLSAAGAAPPQQAPDAAQIARTLIEKYGTAALAYGRERAGRAIEIGDELALDAWHSVIEETRSLLLRRRALA